MQRAWLMGIAAMSIVCACGDPDPSSMGDSALPDASMMNTDGGTLCTGRTLCGVAGTHCEGDTLVVCARDADGCLVSTRQDCGLSGEVCSAETSSCVDACASIPAADRCETLGERMCDSHTLAVCTMTEDGCLALERTDCAASPGGTCHVRDEMPMCVITSSPCDEIPEGDRCETPGTSCDETNLVRCAPNAFGCLVLTRTDCTTRTDGACDASASEAICTTSEACVDECDTPGTSCNEQELVTCEPDAFGCLEVIRTDCAETTFGYCDASATPQTCSTAATDPCMGATSCGTETSRSCANATTLDVCEANAFGCYVSTTTDCGARTPAETCDASSGTAMCVDPCSSVNTCPSASFCDGSSIVHCAADANGCLVETMRTSCDGEERCIGGASPTCGTDACPEAIPEILDCESGTVMGHTEGGTTVRSDYEGCTDYDRYTGAERIYRFRNNTGARQAVRIVATANSIGDFDLFAWDAGDGAQSCTTESLTCLDSSTQMGSVETIDFALLPGQNGYIAYDLFGDDITTDFTLEISCTPVVCGDRNTSTGETCDDGNTSSGDGCSDTCTIEPDFVCYGSPSRCGPIDTCGNGYIEADETCDDGNTTAGDGCSSTCELEEGFRCITTGQPTRCTMQSANATCAGATVVNAEATLTGVDLLAGGAPLRGTGCGASGTLGHFYSVTVDAGRTAVVTVTSTTFDAAILRANECGATTCSDLIDRVGPNRPEQLIITNTTDAPLTQIVHVRNTSASVGTYDITFSYPICGDGVVSPSETCDDNGTTEGDGCSATCTTEPNYICTGTPSACRIPYTTAPITGACADMSTGISLLETGDDVLSTSEMLPFDFSFFDETVTHYRVSSNGWVQVSNSSVFGGNLAFSSNEEIPNTSPPNGLIAPYWDDLVLSGQGVRTLTTGSAGDRRLIVQWDAYRYNTSTRTVHVQAHLIEGTNVIEFHYCALDSAADSGTDGSSATIGLENMAGTTAVATSFNSAGAVMTGSGFRYTPNR